MRKNPKISIIIPTKNEAEGLAKIIRSVKRYASEIIVVDGHSKDNTKQIAKEENTSYFLDKGGGKGDGVRLGIKKANGDILIIFDADGSHEAKDISKLIKPIIEDRADMVITSKITGGSFDKRLDFTGVLRSMGSDFLCFMLNHKFKTNFTDILYSFRAIKASQAKKLSLKSHDFCIEHEMLAKALKKKYRVIEIPSREKKRAWGKSKLKTFEGIKFIFDLFRILYIEK